MPAAAYPAKPGTSIPTVLFLARGKCRPRPYLLVNSSFRCIYSGRMNSARLFLVLIVSTWFAFAAQAAAKPNILWLIAEDLGPQLGCDGAAEVWTPNLDRLAAEGV